MTAGCCRPEPCVGPPSGAMIGPVLGDTDSPSWPRSQSVCLWPCCRPAHKRRERRMTCPRWTGGRRCPWTAGSCCGGSAAPPPAASQRVAPRPPSRRIPHDDPHAVLVDTTTCIGCRKCEWACNQASGLPVEPLETFEDKAVFASMRRPDAGHLTVVNRFDDLSSSGHPATSRSSACTATIRRVTRPAS